MITTSYDGECIDWEAKRETITDDQTGESVTVQAGGWVRPDGSTFAGVLVDGKMFSVEKASELAEALRDAAAIR